jgi:methionyl-tRNA formyltransferase
MVILTMKDTKSFKDREISYTNDSAHYLHRLAEDKYDIDRNRTARTFNRMLEALNPEKPYYGSANHNQNITLEEEELEIAVKYLSEGASTEEAATRSVTEKLLEQRSKSGIILEH